MYIQETQTYSTCNYRFVSLLISSCPLQNVQVCTYKYVSHQSQFDGEEQQDVDFSADVKLSCQSGELAAHTRELAGDTHLVGDSQLTRDTWLAVTYI